MGCQAWPSSHLYAARGSLGSSFLLGELSRTVHRAGDLPKKGKAFSDKRSGSSPCAVTQPMTLSGDV